MRLERLACAFGRRVKYTVEVGGDEPQRTITAACQLLQRCMRIGGTFTAQLGLQCQCQRAAYGKTLPRQASL